MVEGQMVSYLNQAAQAALKVLMAVGPVRLCLALRNLEVEVVVR